jgi:hypothetical protein
MKKIVTLSLVVFLASLFLWGCGSKQDSEIKQKEGETYSGTLQELMKKGKAVKCSFEFDNNGFLTTGSYYIDPKSPMTRGDISMTMEIDGEKKEIINHTIFKDEMVYSWKEGDKTGMVFKEDEEMPEDEGMEEIQEEYEEEGNEFDYSDEQIDFNCVNWKVDKTVFALPQEVNFEDMTQKMQEYTEMPDDLESLEGMEEMGIDMEGYMNMK